MLTAMVGFWATLSLNIPDFTAVLPFAERPSTRSADRSTPDDDALLFHRSDRDDGDCGPVW